MDICAELQIKDKPGTLLSVIEPVSVIGGNIITIVHNRDNTFGDNLSISIIIDIEQGKIRKIQDAWKANGITIIKISESMELRHMDCMLIGKVTGTMLEKFFDKSKAKVDVMKTDIELSDMDGDESAAVIYSVDTPSEDDLDMLDKMFKDMAKKHNLVYVRGLER